MTATDEERAEWERKTAAGETLTQQVHRKLIADGMMHSTTEPKQEQKQEQEAPPQ